MSDLSLIKNLREATGCGIVDCKNALTANNNDFEKSVDWLRKKGLATAAKKSSRVASEGLVAIKINNDKKSAAIIEVNSETDFVARNTKFQDFVSVLANIAVNSGNDVDTLKASKFNQSITIEEEVKNQIGVIGENINLRRSSTISVNQGAVIGYIHNLIASNDSNVQMGKIAVLIALESSAKYENLEDFGKKLAMHIAAAKPDALTIESVDPDKLNREIDVLKEQSKSSGKPESIIAKMIEGRIKKYYEEVVLMEQAFVMDDKVKIKDLINDFSKQNGETKISSFKLFILGEGIEKKESDFAAEVAAMTS